MTRYPAILLAGAALSIVGACSHSPSQIAVANRVNTEMKAHEVTTEMKIGPVPTGDRLADAERAAVRAFAVGYESEGHGALVISRPSNGPDDVSAIRAAADARAVLLAEGVDARDIKEGPYDATSASAAPLILSYRSWEASVPGCTDLSRVDMVWTGTNTALPSFGCALATSLAAQLADAGDLVGKQPMDPSDILRREVVISKYRNGEPTGAVKPEGASGVISGAIGN